MVKLSNFRNISKFFSTGNKNCERDFYLLFVLAVYTMGIGSPQFQRFNTRKIGVTVSRVGIFLNINFPSRTFIFLKDKGLLFIFLLFNLNTSHRVYIIMHRHQLLVHPRLIQVPFFIPLQSQKIIKTLLTLRRSRNISRVY